MSVLELIRSNFSESGVSIQIPEVSKFSSKKMSKMS
jgi:hypothetical protein